MRLESKRASIPTLYLELGDITGELLAHPDLARRWDEDSSLDGMTIGALAAHLVRAFTTTQLYLQADPVPVEDDVDASSYFVHVFARTDEDIAELNANIAQRASDDAEPGVAALIERHGDVVRDLKLALIGEPAERGIEVFEDMAMQLDDYLVTRMVEAVVHSEDLSHSLGVDMPDFPADVMDLVMAALLGVARERHGEVAVLRAFARAERSLGSPLPVF